MEKLAKKYTKFYLNGDGMTNVHPNIESYHSGFDAWYFAMSQKQFDKYLKNYGLEVDDFENIIDSEDNHEYGGLV